MIPDDFDWKNPNYGPVYAQRAARLGYLRALDVENTPEDPKARERHAQQRLAQIKAYYADNIADFIEDWGMTFDPGLIKRKLPPNVPFLLFPKQRQFVDKVIAKWRAGEDLLAEKTRQMGYSWLAVAIGCSLCIFNDGMVVGYGSRKEEYVDKIGDPKSLFVKARMFMDGLPPEFRAGFTRGKTDAHMRLTFPETGSGMYGEAGSNIGRGATTGLTFVDESAFLEHPETVDAALSQSTGCRVDISTPNGLGNPFAQKRFGGLIEFFTMHWRDDPRKDEAWYAAQKARLSSVVLAQEVDIDYAASVAGVIIPARWLQACVDAHLKLQVMPTGKKQGAFDVADEGGDMCAFAIGYGIVVEEVQEWTGQGADIHASTLKAFKIAESHGLEDFTYDADGMGAGVRAAARVINETRRDRKLRSVGVNPFRGSWGVVKPLAEQEPGRKNEDYFKNAKAQSWHWLKHLVYCTWRAVEEGAPFKYDEIISFSSKMTNLMKVLSELSQPTWEENTIGQMIVDKTPDGTKSPNLGDAVMMLYSPCRRKPLRISQKAVDAA